MSKDSIVRPPHWANALCPPLALLLIILLGLFLGPLGGLDTVAQVGWCALVAAPVGVLLSPRGNLGGDVREPGKRSSLAPAILGLCTIVLSCLVCQHYGSRSLPDIHSSIFVLSGLYFLGLGIGAFLWRRGSSPTHCSRHTAAGILLGISISCAGAPILFGLGAEGQSLGSSHPALAECLLLLAPDGLALEVGGFDWSHTNPGVYATSGVEWVLRSPRGPGAAALTLALGVLVFVLGAFAYRLRGKNQAS
ncbi:MAG: hypothetical protein ACI82F_002358 [Planctomycetota bacterium]